MAPSDRRAAITQATVPLLLARGWTVTTKEIAAAAGVAEGTIFSVFEEKQDLLLAALEAALDPEPVALALSQIDLSLPLEDRLVMAIEILHGLTRRISQLSGVLQLEEVRGQLPRHATGERIWTEILPALFEPSRRELRIKPGQAAQVLMVLAGAGSHGTVFEKPLTVPEIVALLLDGIRKRPRST